MGKYTEFARECYMTLQTVGVGAVKDLYKARCMNEDANINAVLGFIVVAAVLFIGIPVLAAIMTATPALPADHPLNKTQEILGTTTQSGYGLLVVTLIIIAMGAVIGGLMMFNRRQ
ncbi:MAG: hypothetical protein WC277_11365 [Bacilli bacterium]|jgi:hypothetical protein